MATAQQNTKLFSPQTNNASEKCPKLLRGKSTQHDTLPLKDRTICVSDLVKLNYFRMCAAVLTVKTLAFQRVVVLHKALMITLPS